MENNTNNKDELAREILENYVKEYKIFIDTCSLLHPKAEEFWANIIPYLEKYQTKVIIPSRSIEEVEKHSKNKDNIELAESAQRCIEKLKQLIVSKYIDIRGESTDNFADNVFLVVFTKFRMQHKLLLITQDNDLSKDIMELNNSRSVKAKNVHVKRINKYGFLSDPTWYEKEKGEIVKHDVEKDEVDEKFRICTQVTNFSADKIKITHMPNEGETVYTSNGTVILTKELGAGGEAIVYETDTQYVAKLYKPETITVRKYEKMKLMLSKDIECPGVCYPVDILYNSHEEFVGFLMPRAKGIEIQKSVFGPKPLFQKKFPGWKKRDTVELCVTILKKIKYLHDRNIIMGDINPANILVVSPTEVYFVDTDSYQVEDFPCPVGTINYTAPEIQKKHFVDFLRTMGNENFAVATLLFMIMLPGKPPYSQQGGEDPVSNIMRMDFSYPFGDSSNKKTPEGPWRYIWSHLTYDLKEAFYKTFRKDEEYSSEDNRLSVDEWLSMFVEYQNLLDSGKFGQQDEMSEELFPTRLKKNPKAIYIKCKLCSQEAEEKHCRSGICRECLQKGEVYLCKNCNKEMLFSNYEKYIKNSKKREICPECYEWGNKVRIRDYCCECGRSFEITNRQYDSYRQNGYDIPKRCKACRGGNKTGSYGSSISYRSGYSPYTPLRGNLISDNSERHNVPDYRTLDYYKNRGQNGPLIRPITSVPPKPAKPKPARPKPAKPRTSTSGIGLDIDWEQVMDLCKDEWVTYDDYVREQEEKKREREQWKSLNPNQPCFITTAVCEYFGKEDDCEELTTLRHYRDTWLRDQEDGEKLIREYYECAPKIVDAMKQSERYGEYCETFLSEYIKPCIAFIHEERFEECKELYIEMVHYAKELTEKEGKETKERYDE